MGGRTDRGRMTTFVVKGSTYWDYWITEDGIFQVRVSDWVRYLFDLMGLLAFIAWLNYLLTGPVRALFLLLTMIVPLILFGIGEIATWLSRRRFSRLSPEELARRGRISRRIGWAQVSSAVLKRSRLSVRWNNRRLRLVLRRVNRSAVREFLRFKLAERLTPES